MAPPLPAPVANVSVPPEVEDNTDIKFRSSFFIGLSFHEYIPKIDLTPIIQNFLHRVCGWTGQTPSMDIEINVRTTFLFVDYL